MLYKSPTIEPSLKNLSYVLRHSELWPEGFEWDYANVNNCAIGLCQQLYGKHPYTLGTMTPGDFKDIFITFEAPLKLFGITLISDFFNSPSKITPKVVADRIDKWLAEHEKDAYQSSSVY